MKKIINNRSQRNKIIIFDIGNVILSFNNMLICEKLSKLSNLSSLKIYKLIFESDLINLLNEGKISPGEFFEEIKKLLKINITFYKFYKIWTEEVFKENVEISQLINYLRIKKYKLCILSNINELHFQYISHKFNIINKFDEYFLSYKIGYQKPNLKIFQKILKKFNLPPDNYIYIDDIEEYINVAKSLGIKGIVFKSATQLRDMFLKFGII